MIWYHVVQLEREREINRNKLYGIHSKKIRYFNSKLAILYHQVIKMITLVFNINTMNSIKKLLI